MDMKEDARKIIDRTDREIAIIISKFNMVANPDQPIGHTQKEDDLLMGGRISLFKEDGPRYLLPLVATLLDFSDKDPKETREMMLNLGTLLMTRFKAVEGVVLQKKNDGQTDSYDKARHDAVVAKGEALLEEFGGNAELGRRIFSMIADQFVKMQNEFLQKGTGPIAKYLEEKENRTPSSTGWINHAAIPISRPT